MQIQTIDLLAGSPGIRQSFQVHRYGTPGASPKVYIQGALHADEVPGLPREHVRQHRFDGVDNAEEVHRHHPLDGRDVHRVVVRVCDHTRLRQVR